MVEKLEQTHEHNKKKVPSIVGPEPHTFYSYIYIYIPLTTKETWDSTLYSSDDSLLWSLSLWNVGAQVKFQGGRNTNPLKTILTGLHKNKLYSPVSASQISACPLQLHGTQGANGPPFAGSWRNPGAQDSQNCPTYPSGQVHISIQLAVRPAAPRRAVWSTTSSRNPTP